MFNNLNTFYGHHIVNCTNIPFKGDQYICQPSGMTTCQSVCGEETHRQCVQTFLLLRWHSPPSGTPCRSGAQCWWHTHGPLPKERRWCVSERATQGSISKEHHCLCLGQGPYQAPSQWPHPFKGCHITFLWSNIRPPDILNLEKRATLIPLNSKSAHVTSALNHKIPATPPLSTLCKEVRSTNWKGAGSILLLLKLTNWSSCSSSHSKIWKLKRKEKRKVELVFLKTVCGGNRKKFKLSLSVHVHIGRQDHIDFYISSWWN